MSGRQLLANRVEADGWTIARMAHAAGVSHRAVKKRVRRFHDPVRGRA